MFFYLSKLLWLVAAPSNMLVLVTLLAAAAACFARGVWRGRGAAVALAAAVVLTIAGFAPIGAFLLRPLESRFPRPDLASLSPAGIIVLGGAVDERIGWARGEPHLVVGADRLTSGVALALRFPDARLIYSGGSAFVVGSYGSEARDARQLWQSLGIAPQRILVEDRSRNTEENAQFTAALLQPKPGERFILVTSAYHMPRSVGLFRKAGIDIVPYPVDYRTMGTLADLVPLHQASEALYLLDVAVREWIGLIAYRASGKTGALLPGP